MSVPKSRRQESDYEIFERSKVIYTYTYNRVKLFAAKDIPYFSLPLYELAKEAFFEIRKILYDNNYKEHCSLAIIYYDEMLEIIELAYASKIDKLPSSVLLEWTKMIEDLKVFLRK